MAKAPRVRRPADLRADADIRAKVELYKAIRPGDTALFGPGSYLHFEKQVLLAMFEAGKRAAREWLDRGPERDDVP